MLQEVNIWGKKERGGLGSTYVLLQLTTSFFALYKRSVPGSVSAEKKRSLLNLATKSANFCYFRDAQGWKSVDLRAASNQSVFKLLTL